MKSPLPALAALVLLSRVAFGSFETELNVLKEPALSAEELKQVLFDAKFKGNLAVQLHNPFRDKVLRGIVVNVRGKTDEGQELSFNLFIDLACGPLQSAYSEQSLFRGNEISASSAVFTLKEVHLEK